MNRKLLLILILISLFSITAVSAFSFDDLFGSGENQTVEVDGIEFNVPAGYSENATQEIINQQQSVGGVNYVTNGKFYYSGLTTVLLYVASYDGYKVDESIVEAVGGNATTINGVDGYLDYGGGYYSFNYPKDDKLVVITTNDKDVIGDFIIP
ncbi:hypothetical protein [Methanobrevibacter sp.]|uniref:hypothetical protein n=1 Tax=Methanobrevibacter sp. TaxID=66852 RepID=UPI0025D3C726|nr:hypothetical protein [Methanobrevibacter sp.]MBR4448305.1 hypothetical protein [Methanobrevibacter sp.]